MKLLLDENLSRRIVAALQHAYPGTTHVVAEGLSTATDAQVWAHALTTGCVMVSKDDDFTALSALHGHPPRLVKLSLGNCSSNATVLDILLRQRDAIERAFADPDTSMVELIRDRATPVA